MGRSTDHDTATDPQSQLADYYQWIEPNSGSHVYINFETAERLQIQALRGLDLNGGVEVGGFLLGRTKLDAGRITAVIEDFEPVACAYSNGPFYGVTNGDTARFVAALERYESETLPSGPSIIGYYRSHKRDDLYLSADDLNLIHRAFPKSDNVFLLIKPLSMRACTGGFFCWDNGSIQSEFTLEVPFAPVRPPSIPPSEEDDVLCPNRLDLSEDLITIPPPLPYPEERRGHKRNLMALALALMVLGIFGYWQLRRSYGVPHEPVAQIVVDSVRPDPIPAQPAPASIPDSQPSPAVQPGNLPQQAPPPKLFQLADTKPTPATTAVADPKLEESPALPSEAKIPTAILPPPAPPNIAPPEIPAPRPEPVAAPATAITFVGPQITYRVNPSVPLDVRSLIVGEAQIDVTVKIDAAGKVTDAQVTSSRGAAARLVAAEAIKAARLCRFQPARENDRAVPGRMVLTFRFRQ